MLHLSSKEGATALNVLFLNINYIHANNTISVASLRIYFNFNHKTFPPG